MRRLLPVLTLLVLLALPQAAARATTLPTAIAAYPAGWSMAGGPPGTDLSAAAVLWQWSNGSYTTPTSARTTICQGYWALYTDPTIVPLDSTATASAQICPLQDGWNLVGNPFAGAAVLPAGVTGYWWNQDRGAYDPVSVIPPGGAVWIFSKGPGSVQLQYLPQATPAPALITISDVTNTGPYAVHVGDSIKLLLPAVYRWTATADPTYLHAEAAGETAALTCIGEPSCVLTPSSQYWTWKAISPGTTTITATAYCTGTTPCIPPIQFQIVIT